MSRQAGKSKSAASKGAASKGGFGTFAVGAAVWLGLTLAAVVHRGRLAAALHASTEIQVPDPLGVALHGAWQDLAVALALGLLAWLSSVLLRRALPWAWARWVLGLTAGAAVVGAVGAICQTHLRTVFSLHSGLTWGLLREALDSGELFSLATQSGWGDLLAALAPAVAVALSLALALRRPAVAAGSAAVVTLVLSGLALALGHVGSGDQPAEVNQSPVLFTALDVARHLHELWDDREVVHAESPRRARGGPGVSGVSLPAGATDSRDVEDDVSEGDGAPSGLRLADGGASPLPVAKKGLPSGAGKSWNIVWVIMESTGRRYLQGESPGGKQPMPFLVDNLAKRGWWLARHRSPSNSSATSIFAQLSGLYPSPSTKMFSVRKDNWVPNLFSFLGDGYDRFLVTPGKLSFFFPRAFLNHGGLTELHGYDELRQIKAVTCENFVRNEIDVMSYFLQRLRRAKPPFAAVYYSFTPHWEYVDYGPQWHRFAGKRAIDRYLNGLYLLDTQIERLVEQLVKDGLLDSTILVVAGDHGEAFGQHERNWTHSRASYEENFATPGLLVQPKLFAPKVIQQDTLHIDLLPTLLDALGIAYDDALFQGESLFQASMRRKHQYFWGNENTLSTIMEGGLKLQWAAGENRCWAYDLAKDPQERRRLGCEKVQPELELLKAYRSQQRSSLQRYSALAREGLPYGGHQHPGLFRPAASK